MRVHAAGEVERQIADFIKSMQRQTGAAPPFWVTTRVVETGEAVLMPSVPLSDFMDALNDDTKAYLAAHPPPATTPTTHMGVLVVPMHARGSIVGALGLFERRSSNPLTQRDVVSIQQVAERIVLAADNGQLYVDAVSRLERLTALR